MYLSNDPSTHYYIPSEAHTHTCTPLSAIKTTINPTFMFLTMGRSPSTQKEATHWDNVLPTVQAIYIYLPKCNWLCMHIFVSVCIILTMCGSEEKVTPNSYL